MALLQQDDTLVNGVPISQVGGTERAAFIRKVYSLFFSGLLMSGVGGFVGLATGIAVPMARHPFMTLIVFFGVFLLANATRKTPGLNVLMLFVFTFVAGLIISPALAVAAYKTGGFGVVLNAFGITSAAFAGLTAYTFISRKDFSYMGGMLTVGLVMVIVAIIANIFIGSSVFSLAISCVVVIVFCGFVLYDTSRIMRTHAMDEYVSAAMSLFLDFINIFLAVLRLLSRD